MLKNLWNSAKAVCSKVAEKAQALAVVVVSGAGAMLGFGEPAHAAGPDMTTLTSAVDFGTVTTAILGVAAALIVVYIAWKGAKMVLGAVKGG